MSRAPRRTGTHRRWDDVDKPTGPLKCQRPDLPYDQPVLRGRRSRNRRTGRHHRLNRRRGDVEQPNCPLRRGHSQRHRLPLDHRLLHRWQRSHPRHDERWDYLDRAEPTFWRRPSEQHRLPRERAVLRRRRLRQLGGSHPRHDRGRDNVGPAEQPIWFGKPSRRDMPFNHRLLCRGHRHRCSRRRGTQRTMTAHPALT